MKTEKEKMLDGELYNSGDAQLTKERDFAKAMCFEFNHTHPSDKVKRESILRDLLDAEGTFHIEAPFQCDYGYNIHLGNNFYANFNCLFLDDMAVTIGDNVMFGPSVQVYTATHPLDPVERNSGLEFSKPIVIGNNVWVGGGAIICPGVTIGDNVTIGAGSVVTKDIPSNVFAAGNPCRVIKEI